MNLKNLRIAAAIIALVYIAVQGFQWWVFGRVPAGSDQVGNFLAGGHPLHILRSWLMLISMFGLWFIFFAVCYIGYQYKKVYSLLAFVAFSVFSFLEIVLRSTELFYIQKALPLKYLATTDEGVRQGIMNTAEVFAEVQSALYFPLLFSLMIGSLLIAISFPASRINRALKASFWINAIRLLLRLFTMYLGINLFPDSIYSILYLPMVVVIFGLLAFWCFQYKQDQLNPQNNEA